MCTTWHGNIPIEWYNSDTPYLPVSIIHSNGTSPGQRPCTRDWRNILVMLCHAYHILLRNRSAVLHMSTSVWKCEVIKPSVWACFRETSTGTIQFFRLTLWCKKYLPHTKYYSRILPTSRPVVFSVSLQGSFCVCPQAMTDDNVTPSFIGWTHTHNDPCFWCLSVLPISIGVASLGSQCKRRKK